MKNRTTILLLAIVMVTLVAVAPLSAQTTFKGAFQGFADDISNSLPLTSTIGNNTADAYIGQFLRVPPNIGFGFTVGWATIPYDTLKDLFGDLSIPVPSAVSNFSGIGVPNPAYTIDARMGGFILPFDFGVKFGTLGDGGLNAGNLKTEFLLVGGDVRYAVMQQGLVKPNISVGVGFNHMRGQILVRDAVSTSYEVQTGPSTSETINAGADAFVEWTTNVIDFKAQVSKSFIILTPYAGLGASYGISNAGGGLRFKADIDADPQVLRDAGIDVDGRTIGVTSDANGWSFRAFGGTSINILLLRLDLGLGYDLLGENFVGTVGTRIQL